MSPDLHDSPVPDFPAAPAADLRARLIRALQRRAALLADPATTCCRLVNGLADELPGFVVERFGPVAVVQDRTGQAPLIAALVSALGEFLGPGGQSDLGLQAVYVKHFIADRSSTRDDKTGPLYDPTPAWGEPSEPEITVLENGLPFRIRPYDGFSVGLFLDQRNNRQAVRQTSAGCRVLNTFCYTGGFSAAALAGGAARVVSVDVSKKYLDWAKRNCEENVETPKRQNAEIRNAECGMRNAEYKTQNSKLLLSLNSEFRIQNSEFDLPPNPQRPTPSLQFFAIPIFDFFRAARKRGEVYDRIILDPPSFARDKKGRPFSATHDYPRLIREAWDLLAPRGQLWACTNHSDLGVHKFLRLVHVALMDQRSQLLEVPPPPADFPGKWPPIRTVRVEK